MSTNGSTSLRAVRAARLQRRRDLIAAALQLPGALATEDAVVVIDLDEVRTRAQALRHGFPYSTLHALRTDLRAAHSLIAAMEGGRFGLCLGPGDGLLAALPPLGPDRVVAAGTGRTEAELRALIGAGICVNIDSLQELRWLEAAPQAATGAHCLTVNFAWGAAPALRPPLLQGVDATDDRAAIHSAFKRKSPLRGVALALHPSWGPEAVCAAVAELVRLADEIEAAGGKVSVLDLGDVVPLTAPDDEPMAVQALIDRLAVACPDLMLGVLKGRWTLRTGIGAGVFGRATTIISRVHSTRRVGGRNHAWCGAPHLHDITEVAVHTADGQLKRGAHAHWDLHGANGNAPPLSSVRYLPPLAPGDLLWLRGMGIPGGGLGLPILGAHGVDGALQLHPLPA